VSEALTSYFAGEAYESAARAEEQRVLGVGLHVAPPAVAHAHAPGDDRDLGTDS